MTNLIQNYKKYLLFLIALIVAFLAGKYSGPAMHQEKQKDVIATHEDVTRNQDVVVTTKETKMPDGTVITETRKEKQTETQTQKDSKKVEVSVETTDNRPGWQVGVIYDPAIRNFQPQETSVIVQKRLFSEVYTGVSASTLHTYGVVISFGF